MVILIRVILVAIIIYLLVRSFYRYFQPPGDDRKVQEPENSNSSGKKKISKEIGEYIDYEEIKEDN